MSEFLVSLLGERLVGSQQAEVDVHSLAAPLQLLGLYFGCSRNGPCEQFNTSLRYFYSTFKKRSEHRGELEIVFVSSDQDQQLWQEFVQDMPWPSLPINEKHRKVGTSPGIGRGDRCPPSRNESPRFEDSCRFTFNVLPLASGWTQLRPRFQQVDCPVSGCAPPNFVHH
uniref:Thioredoxin-like fold domain-containing protein n=1 Tax=Erpetoichthys calabaricus TaxID=27687 RepID=A0A8C4S3S0_ERPCA